MNGILEELLLSLSVGKINKESVFGKIQEQNNLYLEGGGEGDGGEDLFPSFCWLSGRGQQ